MTIWPSCTLRRRWASTIWRGDRHGLQTDVDPFRLSYGDGWGKWVITGITLVTVYPSSCQWMRVGLLSWIFSVVLSCGQCLTVVWYVLMNICWLFFFLLILLRRFMLHISLCFYCIFCNRHVTDIVEIKNILSDRQNMHLNRPSIPIILVEYLKLYI